jgi:hypothetical protein
LNASRHELGRADGRRQTDRREAGAAELDIAVVALIALFIVVVLIFGIPSIHIIGR